MSVSNKRPVAGSRSPARSKTDLDVSRRTRMGLLGTTALIAAGLACSPAFAQTVSPAGGGSITYTPGSASSTTPGASDGVSITNGDPYQSTINGVSILNTTGVPTADAVRLLSTSGVTLTGANSLRTTVNGGAGLYVQSNANLGINLSGGGNTFQGSYGVRALAAGGFVNFNSAGQTQTITGNGTALIGIDVQAALHPEVYFGTSVVSGFATGVQLTQSITSGGYVLFNSTGGSISASGTGIRADAVNGAADVTSQTAISAAIGINATGGSTNITTSGAGTINANVSGSGTGILVASSAGAGPIAVNVGASIGATTAGAFGVNVTASGTSSGAINITTTATVRGTTAGIVLTRGASTPTNTVSVGADVIGGINGFAAGTTIFTVAQGATVSGTISASSRTGALVTNSSAATVSNSGAIINGGVTANDTALLNLSGASTTNTATGTITGRTGVYQSSSVTTSNAGVITGSGAVAGEAGVRTLGGTVGNTGTIQGGYDGILNAGNILSINNTAGTIRGAVNGIRASAGFVSVTNTGLIETTGGTAGAGQSGILINTVTAGSSTVTNTGTIQGGSHPTNGYGIQLVDGGLTVNNNSGGVITGGLGAMLLSSDDAVTLNLNASSTVTGSIISSGLGGRTVSLSGTITGAYDAGGGGGVDAFTLGSAGSITGAVSLGGGDDTFTWSGGTIGSTIDGGASGTDIFNGALGVGNSASISQSILTNFEVYRQSSGTLTLTGASDGGYGWNVLSGATLALSGSLTNVAGVSGDAISMVGGTTVNILGTGVVSGLTGVLLTGTGNGTISNAGAITASNFALGTISATAVLNLTNSGAITSTGGNGVVLGNAGGTVVNSGTVTGAGVYYGLSSTGTTSVTNNVGGLIRGGFMGVQMSNAGTMTLANAGTISGTGANSYGVNLDGGALNLTNQSGGVINGVDGSIRLSGAGAATVTLNSGSTTTGNMLATGSGTRTLTLAGAFAGNVDASANSGAVNLTLNTSATGYTLLQGGTGADTLTFAGSGSRTFSVDNLSSWNTGAFTGGGGWTLTGTGNQTSFISGLSIGGGTLVTISDTRQLQGATGLTMSGGGGLSASTSLTNSRTISLIDVGALAAVSGQTLTQTGVISGSGSLSLTGAGSVVLSGNNTYSGGTTVYSGILQLNHTSAAGTGVIRMIDPQINFAATGTYNNAISLEVADGQQAADPTILNKAVGGSITLAGRIYETAGVGGANQYVTFNGGDIYLTNNANSWGGVSTINNNTVVFIQSGGVNGLSGGSIVDNGVLYYLNNTAGTVAQNISGSGGIQIGSTAPVTFAGNITTAGSFTVLNNAAAVVAGTRSGASSTGVLVSGSGARLGVADGGSITGGGQLAVHMTGPGSTLDNLGSITNSGAANAIGASVYVQATSGTITINNGSAADTGAGSTIRGWNAGIRHDLSTGGLLVVNNYGLVLGDQYNGIENSTGSLTVNNFAGGYITTGGNGNGVVSGSAGAVSITNAGVIGRNPAATTTVSGYGVYTNGVLTLNNQAGGQIHGTQGGVLTNAAGASITNTGSIYADSGPGLTLALGGAVTNGGAGLTSIQNAASRLESGSFAAIAVTNGAFSLTNYGQVVAAGSGVQIGTGGAYTGAVTINNAGLIQGSSNDGVQLYTAATVNNLAGGTITGANAALRLTGAHAFTLNLNAGSTVNGAIDAAASSGANTTVLGGALTAEYAGGSGVDTFTLGATGSMTSADLGGGADSFIYQGGAFSGLIAGGTGTDSFTSALGAGSASISLNLISGFESFTHQSGTLTLTGVGTAVNGVAVQGGTLIVDGILPYAASVANGATLSGGGRVGAVTVANGGALANVQGSTLTMASLDLSSGSFVNATFSGAGGSALFAVTGGLTLDGTVNVASTGAYGFGVYGLMTYGGALNDQGLLLGSTPAGAQGMTLQTSVAGQINIVHSPSELLFWDGGNGAQHDNGAVNGGAGVWTAAGSNWTDSGGLSNGAMQPQPGFAIFQAPGGVVTVDNSLGAVGVTGMQFAANGYSIVGDALTLAEASTIVRVGNGTAPGAGWSTTIASALTGAGGLVKTDLGTLILTGDSDYTGGTTVNAGTLRIGDGAAAGSITGSVVLANGSTLAFSRNDNHDFANAVSGAGTVAINGAVTLSGAITATGGVSISAGSSGTLSNVNLTSGNAVLMASGASATVTAGGLVQSQAGTGIFATGLTASISNLGTITGGTTAIFANADLSLTNAASGTINGAFAVSALQNLDLTNDGSINASTTNFNSSGIYAGGTGTISNTGSIISASNAIYTQGAGSVTNSGLIQGGGAASTIRLFGANSTVTNLAGGEINTTGTGVGVFTDGTGATVFNAGTIRGGNAVNFVAGGGTLTNEGVLIGANGSAVVGNGGTVIANLTGGAITGATNGVNVVTGSGVVTNDGAMTGTTGQGVLLQAAGSVINTGSITGGQSGVRALAGLTLSNAGAISGSVNAIESVGVFNDSLTFLAGSTTNGAVLAGQGDDLISLAGTLNGALDAGDGADTVSLFETAAFTGLLDGGAGTDAFILDGTGSGSVDMASMVNFESRAKEGTGSWTLTGTDGSTLGWSINAGVLAASGGSSINDGSTVTIAGGATLALLNDETIGALAGSGFVDLGGGRLTLAGAATTTYDGVMSGAGGLTVGSGYGLTLTGANTNTGTTIVDGVLRLGASDVLADGSNLLVNAGGIVDLQNFDDTVFNAFIDGVLNGSGTLTADVYELDGAVIAANLGDGLLVNIGGASILSGTSGAADVIVDAGSLTLGAAGRLSDTAFLHVASGGVLDLQVFDETVYYASIYGALDGSGTLTAEAYELDGATVNANLGGGLLYALGFNGSANVLNGTSDADFVSIEQAGVLQLGASDRLKDTAIVATFEGSFDLQGFDDTIYGVALQSASLDGTGTLTADIYVLADATVNANLGAGILLNFDGVSVLNGTSQANLVGVDSGTLVLGASERIVDTADLQVFDGATFDLGAFDETLNVTEIGGTLDGTGTLTANQHQLDGATVNANLAGGPVYVVGGDSTLNGLSAGNLLSVLSGSLTLGASNRIADAATLGVADGATLNLGAFNEGVAIASLAGTLNGTGTLTAGEYQLDGATVNANLGAGDLFNVGGTSTLTGTSAAANVVVQAGTLVFGASDRLADTATVSVASGSTLNVGAFNDTVNLAVLNGALSGAGTLTAAQYQLTAATVNANVGAGVLFNLGGVSTLNGAAAASQIAINAGTLRLGANERLSDAATVSVATGATFNVNGFNERIGALFGTGDVNVGAGRLTFGGVESGFGGRLSGAGSVVHTAGLFTLLGDHSIASISNTGGELRFLGTTTGGLSASGGSVTGAGTIGGALTASNGAVLSPGLAGVQNGIGGFMAGGLSLNGGTLAIDVLGASAGNLIDQLRINGAATLTGGILAPMFHGTGPSDFATRYLFLQANNLVGTFANGSTFTAANQEGLFWRVRYDLAPNAAVLELRQLTSFDPGASGTGNQRSIGQALSGGQLGASDDWAAVLGLIAGLNADERSAAFDSISGEPLANVTTSMFSANDSFLTAMREGGLGGRSDGGEALNFVDSLSFSGGRENSADRLGDVLGAFDPTTSAERGAGGWVSAYSGDQTLEGKPGQATVESKLNGFAGGYGVRHGSMSLGAAAGATRVEGDVVARQGHYESDLSHAAGYIAFDDGVWAAEVSASFYGGDLDTRRGITIGAFSGAAIGNTHTEGQALSASVARRFQVTDNTMIALGAIGTASNASVDGYTETGAGALSLQASGQERDWQSLQLSVRGTQDYRVDGRGFRIYGGAGVMAMAGDRQATGDMRFTGAPVGFGTFVVEGAEAPPVAGLADFGIEVGAGEGVTVSAGYRGLFSERLQDNQVGVKLNVSW